MTSHYQPGVDLRIFQRLRFPHKMGVGERLWRQSLAARGQTWVSFDRLNWKLNLANDTHRWLVYGEYEEMGVRRLLERILRTDSVIIDSGANIGQMILMYLRVAPLVHIHAFEPTPAARAWIEECVAANKLENVIVSALALGDISGPAALVLHNFNFKEGAQNRISEAYGDLAIEMSTLDDYARTHRISQVRLWKIDTEGSELAALRGAASLLRQSAVDYLYVETGNIGVAIADELASFGYFAVPFSLNRLLPRKEINIRFSNVFVSERIARDECGLACPS